MGISEINLRVNVEKSSARALDAETTKMFLWGSSKSWWQTKAEVIQDLPTPRNAMMQDRLGPFWR
jgi:hypothetical protein